MVDDGVLLLLVELGGREQQAVEIGGAVARLYGDGIGGFREAAFQLRSEPPPHQAGACQCDDNVNFVTKKNVKVIDLNCGEE